MTDHSLLSSISLISDCRTRSISPENITGEKGKGAMATDGVFAKEGLELGPGWKNSPCLRIKGGETVTIAEIHDMGEIRHIWMSGDRVNWRLGILRFYWDGCPVPSVECPMGDFFGSAEPDKLPAYNSLSAAVNPTKALNSYWSMPFKKSCRVTFENLAPQEILLFYEITYVLCPVPDNAGYFHAQFRRCHCVPYKDVYTVVDDIKGKGQYVGTYMYFCPHGNDWWGEGEAKFYIDGDTDHPTICGTGTEDYFCGAWAYLTKDNRKYLNFHSPYCGFAVTEPEGDMFRLPRYSLYRWHITDPIYFGQDLKFTIQDLGWKGPDRSLGFEARRDDISSAAFWYQDRPAEHMHALPCAADLAMI